MDNLQTVSGPLGQALEARREEFNARFELRRRAGARIDAAAFLRHLAEVVDPVVRRVHQRFAERLTMVVDVLYDVSLALFAQSLLGPGARSAHVLKAWKDVLPAAPALVARDPLRAAGGVSNAAVQLVSQNGTRPEEWLRGMRDTAEHCDSVALWLDCGKVLAWRAGMVQYRRGALEVARQLPATLAALCLGLPEPLGGEETHRVIDQLDDDPWLTPAEALRIMQSPRLPDDRLIQPMEAIGDFAGFGGPFRKPPIVTNDASHLVATDGQRTWQLLADAHGAHLHPLGKGSFQAARRGGSLSVEGNRITWNDDQAVLPNLVSPTSIAADEHTAAVTCGTSFFVFLLARKRRL
jgi:hypothetical protein